MRALADADYQALRQGAEVIEADRHGDKVLRLRDGNYIKLFRRKRLLSSAALFPYAERFARNAEQLERRGIPSPRILATWRVPGIARDLVHYEPLPGDTLRHLKDAPASVGLQAELGRFVAELHNQGVYFRSLHLGNVVMTPQQRLGLIDIADLTLHRRPLRKSLCLRNFQHMLRYQQDRDWLLADHDRNEGFLRAYARHSLHAWSVERLKEALVPEV